MSYDQPPSYAGGYQPPPAGAQPPNPYPQGPPPPAYGHASYGAPPPYSYPPPYGAPPHGSYPPPGGAPLDEVRTIFVTGFPLDVKERELNNLMRFLPGYEVKKRSRLHGVARFWVAGRDQPRVCCNIECLPSSC